MLVAKQAYQFIAFTDNLYLGILIKRFEKEFGTLKNLYNRIFEIIKN